MVKVAAVQMAMDDNKKTNIDKAEALVREASTHGAQVVLLPEL
jgi:predicted amidohydrolase